MTLRAARWLPATLLVLSSGLASGQIGSPSKPDQPPGKTPTQAPTLAGAKLSGVSLALGPQRIDGNLRRPLVDYSVKNGARLERVSFFEGGLIVVHLTEPGGVIQKKLLLPDDAEKRYLDHLSAAKLAEIPADLFAFASFEKRKGTLRIYDGQRFVERSFDPSAALPRALADLIVPLEDLVRAISEDNRLSSHMSGYQPRVGDHVVAEDGTSYLVVRIFGDDSMIELRRDNQPITIYMAKKDLYNHIVGARQGPPR
jgi:hypothetical protein